MIVGSKMTDKNMLKHLTGYKQCYLLDFEAQNNLHFYFQTTVCTAADEQLLDEDHPRKSTLAFLEMDKFLPNHVFKRNVVKNKL